MNPTTPQLVHAPSQSASRRPTAPPRPDSSSLEAPTWGELFEERAVLIGTPAFFGPPIIFVLGPWLLLILLLIGPTALLITLVLAGVLAIGLLVALVGVVASPYLLVRHLRAGHRARRRRPSLVARSTGAAAAVAGRGSGPHRSGWLPVPAGSASPAQAVFASLDSRSTRAIGMSPTARRPLVGLHNNVNRGSPTTQTKGTP